MGKIPEELRETIARNIRECRMRKFPGRGGGKKCAEAFGVSPQQWSPWERGMRTPDESRLAEMAKFFEVTVEYLRRDNRVKDGAAGAGFEKGGYFYPGQLVPGAPSLREPEAPPYGLPSLRRDDNLGSGNHVAEMAMISARLMGLIGSTTKGVSDGRFDIGKAIIIMRRLGDILEQKLREADGSAGGPPRSY